MAFSGRLDDGEEVILAVRPHWWCFAPTAAILAAALILAVASATYGVPEPVQLLVVLLTLVALGRFVARYARWATTRFVVTSERIVHRRGVVARRGTEIPLRQVRGASCRQSLGERVLRCGEVVIDVVETGEQRFGRLPRPSLLGDEIRAAVHAHRQRWAGGWSHPLSMVDQLERLDELCRRGVLSRAEFDRKKEQLLERM